MSFIEIEGGIPLQGEVKVQGSKNAVLPIMAAAVLHEGVTRLNGCPRISDIEDMAFLLKEMGCLITWHGDCLQINAVNVCSCAICGLAAKKTRSSILLMGTLLGRLGCAETTFPGGCVIGSRPIDYHLEAFRKMNVAIEEILLPDHEFGLSCSTKELVGADITLNFPSVGATENIILAATRAGGVTIIRNAAREPEISSLCEFLVHAGAIISGIGTDRIRIEGVKALRDTTYCLPADRIVAGTYLAGAAMTGGDVTVNGISESELLVPCNVLRKIGCALDSGDGWIRIRSDGRLKAYPGILKTEPFPGFPTDLQSQFMALLSLADGESRIQESIFEERFLVVEELIKMGAAVLVNHKDAYIIGVESLKGSTVLVKELRGGAALVLAGLAAKGKTKIQNTFYIHRGYEDIVRDLRGLGAKIRESAEINHVG